MKTRIVLALSVLALGTGAASAGLAGPAWAPPGWPNQPIDGGHPPAPAGKLIRVQTAPAPDSIAGMAARLEALKGTASESFKGMMRANEDAPPKAKEMKLWEEQAKPMAARLKVMEGEEATNNAQIDRMNLKVRQWNADCAGHPLTNAQDAVCGDRQAQINREKAPSDQKKAQLDAEATQIMKQFANIQAKWRSLDGELTAMRDQYNGARARYVAATAEYKQLQTIMQSRCDKERTPEAMAHCGQVQWDGARRGLPALDNPPPPFAVSAN